MIEPSKSHSIMSVFNSIYVSKRGIAIDVVQLSNIGRNENRFPFLFSLSHFHFSFLLHHLGDLGFHLLARPVAEVEAVDDTGNDYSSHSGAPADQHLRKEW